MQESRFSGVEERGPSSYATTVESR
jgi:hypothetical protein